MESFLNCREIQKLSTFRLKKKKKEEEAGLIAPWPSGSLKPGPTLVDMVTTGCGPGGQ